MHFYDQSIRAYSPRRSCHWRYFVALARAMAGVDQYWQVTQSLHCRHYAQVQCVASVVSESTYSALAQDDVVVAFAHHVLRGHQKLFQRCRHSALQQDRLLSSTRALEQRKVLHIAGADLDDV